MIKSKILFVRGRYHEYDDAEIITLPRIAAGEILANMARALYRKIKYLFCSVGIALGMVFFVKSSKYAVIQHLHYGDLVDAMKKEV